MVFHEAPVKWSPVAVEGPRARGVVAIYKGKNIFLFKPITVIEFDLCFVTQNIDLFA